MSQILYNKGKKVTRLKAIFGSNFGTSSPPDYIHTNHSYMNESPQPPESEKRITREEVIEGYKKFVAQGITNPDDLDLDDQEVKKAHDLYYKWQEQEKAQAHGDEELTHRIGLTIDMLYVDAGFNDPEYLNEVLAEWLVMDAGNAEKQKGSTERTETRHQISEAIKKIRSLLRQPE